MSSRTLSLHAWLALALVVVVAVPALAVGAGWAGAGQWQSGREAARLRDAEALLRASRLDSASGQVAAARRLERLGVQAQVSELGIVPDKAVVAPDQKAIPAAKLAMGKRPLFETAGLQAIVADDGGKQTLTRRYCESQVKLTNAVASLWVARESAGTRWAITLGAGLVALVAALGVVVVLLRRWVLAPLARLAADADRIAGGELDVEPLPTRAREIAQVGDALRGMAGGLRDALATSSAAERDRRFMVTAIAHDLRTPLFTLRGSLEALEHGVGDGRYLDRAQDKAAHLDHLISDLFTFSRLEYAAEAIAREEVDVATLVRRATETVAPLAEARGARLEVRETQPGLAVRGDAEALLRVLTNLLDNATRHARDQVVLAAHRSNGVVRMEVADDGPGFAPKDLSQVFDPLFRSDRARAAATGGTGLGLAIARRLARAHGGDVQAANDPGAGARAIVTLPACD
jgi:signal transduction histidine kinase